MAGNVVRLGTLVVCTEIGAPEKARFERENNCPDLSSSWTKTGLSVLCGDRTGKERRQADLRRQSTGGARERDQGPETEAPQEEMTKRASW